MHHLWPDVDGKGDDADEDAQRVDRVVAVARDVAGAAAGDAALLVGLYGTREGLGAEGRLPVGTEGGWQVALVK